MSSCVIHLKPGISWCTSKTCIYDAYGLYAVKDFTHRSKARITKIVRNSKKHRKHNSDGETRIASKKLPVKNGNGIVSIVPDKNISIPIIEDEFVIDTPKVLANLRINFAFDKDTISAQDKINIKEYISKISIGETADILIKGFTDNAGSETYNKHLSIKRARRVYEYLIMFGIPRSKLSFKGFDFKDPVADNKTEEGRSLNRRVEIEIIFKKDL